MAKKSEAVAEWATIRAITPCEIDQVRVEVGEQAEIRAELVADAVRKGLRAEDVIVSERQLALLPRVNNVVPAEVVHALLVALLARARNRLVALRVRSARAVEQTFERMSLLH